MSADGAEFERDVREQEDIGPDCRGRSPRARASTSGARKRRLFFSLVTLDLRLGHENGLELAREFRAKGNVAVVMISGKGAVLDRIGGLEQGADDYIAKPFHMREVLLRIRNALRRYERPPAEIELSAAPDGHRYAFDNCRFDALKREYPSRQLESGHASRHDDVAERQIDPQPAFQHRRRVRPRRGRLRHVAQRLDPLIVTSRTRSSSSTTRTTSPSPNGPVNAGLG